MRHNVEALKLYLDYFQATQDFDFATVKKGYDAMRAHWEKAYTQNSDLVSNEAPGYLIRFLKNFVDEALQYASPPYRMVLRLPDTLATQFDEKVIGHGEGYDYSHDHPGAWVDQQYLPERRRYYEPTDRGFEATIRQRLEELRRRQAGG